MTRDLLIEMLDHTTGVDKDGASWQTKSEHKMQFYVGTPGQSLLLPMITRCQLEERYAVLSSRENGTQHYVPIEHISAFSLRVPEEGQQRRPGFA
ncbi:MAG: hypothetical protein ACPGUV_12105 [Polyangiales bacterium]